MVENENVTFPTRCKPLPPGYKIVQLDSGHFMWVFNDGAQGEAEGHISWDRWWVRRCAFAHFEKYGAPKGGRKVKRRRLRCPAKCLGYRCSYSKGHSGWHFHTPTKIHWTGWGNVWPVSRGARKKGRP